MTNEKVRRMGISIIGCLSNCMREYGDKIATVGYLLNDIKEICPREIIENLSDKHNSDADIDEIIEDFMDEEHGMIKIGSMLISDLLKARHDDYEHFELLVCKNEEDKNTIHKMVEMLG